jgi:pimeloyl-ACP methyl ester carboxylesterase
VSRRSYEEGGSSPCCPGRTGLGTVIIIHGLWMSGLEMRWMMKSLRDLGYRVVLFRYHSVRVELTDSAEVLYHFWQKIPGPVYLFCHSLGGLLALHMLQRYAETRSSRMVAVGTPFSGSRSAQKIARIPWIGRRILGGSIDHGLLHGGPYKVLDGCEIGVIAGNFPLGLSQLLFAIVRPSDGTVSVVETYLPGSEHIQVSHSHMGLIFSSRVAELADHFFQMGKFS